MIVMVMVVMNLCNKNIEKKNAQGNLVRGACITFNIISLDPLVSNDTFAFNMNTTFHFHFLTPLFAQIQMTLLPLL